MAVRIPKSFVPEASLNQQPGVDVSVIDGPLVIKPLPEPTWSLEELLSNVTYENAQEEIDAGPAVGREIW